MPPPTCTSGGWQVVGTAVQTARATAHRRSGTLTRHTWALFRFYNHLFILIFLFNPRKDSFSNVHKGGVRVSVAYAA